LRKLLRRISALRPREFLRHSADPFPVFLDIAGIDAKEVFSRASLVYEEVVYHASILVAHHGILGLAIGQLRNVVGYEVVQKFLGGLAFHCYLAHMAYVEEPRFRSHALMLLR
jgi:hypothetical protein